MALPFSTVPGSLPPLYDCVVQGVRLPLSKSLLTITCLGPDVGVGVEEGASDVVDDELGASGDSPGSGFAVR